MMRFKALLQLNIKRGLGSLLQLIFGAAALIFLVSAVAFCGNKFLYGIMSEIAENSSFSLGVIIEDDSKLANKVTDAILNMSEVNSTFNLIFTEKDNAIDMLKNGEIIAILMIPKDTAHNIIHGKNTPMTIIFPEDSGFEAVIIKEIADSVATMLSSAQAGIYSIYDFYEEHNASNHIDDALDRMNLKYISVAATGNKMFKEETITATGSIPLMTYYISGGLVLFILLFGINCYSFLQKLPAATSKRLSLSGTSITMQGLSTYITIALMQLLAIIIIIVPAVFIMDLFGLSLEASSILGLIFTLPIFIIISAALVFVISSITNIAIGRVMITFWGTIIMCFISGCFIPNIMLPEVLQHISKLLPTHYMIKFLSNIMAGEFEPISLIICLIYPVILFLLGVLFSYTGRRKELT